MPTSIKYFLYPFLFLGYITLSSCTNEYEQKAIGHYETYKYELLNSTSSIDSPILVLNKGKVFILNFKNKKIKGKWEANDYGDWTVVDFYYDNHLLAQGQLLGQNFEIIQIINPSDFYINAKSFSFKRIENH